MEIPVEGPSSRFSARLSVLGWSLLIIALVVYFLEKFAVILQPLLIAQLLTYVLHPASAWLQSRGLSIMFAYLVLFAMAGLVLFGLGELLAVSVRNFQENLPQYESRVERISHRIVSLLPNLESHEEQIRERQRSLFSSGANLLGQTLGNAVTLLAFFFFVLINLIFLTAEQSRFPDRVHLWFTPARAKQILEGIHVINYQVGRYLGVKVLSSAMTGMLTAGVLALFGVDFAVLWGLLAFLFNFIPYIGSIIACVPPILLSLLQFDNVWTAFGVLIALTAVQQFTGVLLETTIMGNRLQLSPLIIIVSLGFWGQVWGVVGMILAIPLMVVIRTFLDNIEETRWIAALMSKPK